MPQLLNRNQTRVHPPRPQAAPPSGKILSRFRAGLLGELMTFTGAIPPAPSGWIPATPQPDDTFKTLLPEVKRALHYRPVAQYMSITCRRICAGMASGRLDVHDSSLLQSATFVLGGESGENGDAATPAPVYPAAVPPEKSALMAGACKSSASRRIGR